MWATEARKAAEAAEEEVVLHFSSHGLSEYCFSFMNVWFVSIGLKTNLMMQSFDFQP